MSALPKLVARRPIVVVFQSYKAASFRVAGVPAAARAVRHVARAGARECWLSVPGYQPLPLATRAEITRMADGMTVHLLPGGSAAPGAPQGRGDCLLVSGEALVEPSAIRAAHTSRVVRHPSMALAPAQDAATLSRLGHGLWGDARGGEGCGLAGLKQAGEAILAATAKPGDGIVSRYINRRVSQPISRALLRLSWVRPLHATAGTALLGLAMLACLALMPGQGGLVAGALLFQAASVFDGVDGEIARASDRCTPRGAVFDSLVDAATNLGFVGGVTFNLLRSGEGYAADFGLLGLLCLGVGLFVLGRRARMARGQFSFDGLKHKVRGFGGGVGQWLIWLTMRDFLALAAVVLVLAGWAAPALEGFAVIMAGWLALVLVTGFKPAPPPVSNRMHRMAKR